MLGDPAVLAGRLLYWWDNNQADLPWRSPTQRHANRAGPDPYAVWAAEVMLQQTQINTVIPYYQRWMERYPSVHQLAEATLGEVMKSWQGLGYYGRARNLHRASRLVVDKYGGHLPGSANELLKLPGIGPYTAGAIASICYDEPVPAVDGNVKRVLSRLVDLAEDITLKQTVDSLWSLADSLVPVERPGDFNQALMELGQQICQPAQPKCSQCPLVALCRSRARGTQLERPVRPARKRRPHYQVTAAVIRRGDGRILITQRPLDGLLGGLWEFPGGKVHDGESLAEALRREINEELAVNIEVGLKITALQHAYTHFRITLHAFEATIIDGQVRNQGVMDHTWANTGEMEDYAFPATDMKIIRKLSDANW